MPEEKKNNGTKQWLWNQAFKVIGVLLVLLLGGYGVVLKYNYADDEKRDEKNIVAHKKTNECVNEIDKKVAVNTVNIETIKEDVKEIKQDTREILRRLPK